MQSLLPQIGRSSAQARLQAPVPGFTDQQDQNGGTDLVYPSELCHGYTQDCHSDMFLADMQLLEVSCLVSPKLPR